MNLETELEQIKNPRPKRSNGLVPIVPVSLLIVALCLLCGFLLARLILVRGL